MSKPNYEANRRKAKEELINKLKEEYKDDKTIGICTGTRCKDRVQPINDFDIKSDGTLTTCATCRRKYINKNKTVSKEAQQRARYKYDSNPFNKIKRKIRNLDKETKEYTAEYMREYRKKQKNKVILDLSSSSGEDN